MFQIAKKIFFEETFTLLSFSGKTSFKTSVALPTLSKKRDNNSNERANTRCFITGQDIETGNARSVNNVNGGNIVKRRFRVKLFRSILFKPRIPHTPKDSV